MADKLNDELQKLVSKNNENSAVKESEKGSTFAQVYPSKNSPVQVQMDKQLPLIIGSKFLLVGVEREEKVDEKSGEIKTTSVYSVRVISRKAKAFREIIQIKVKNAKPILNDDELDKVMMELTKPVILRFENIAHYAYIGGESMTASSCERLSINVQETMKDE